MQESSELVFDSTLEFVENILRINNPKLLEKFKKNLAIEVTQTIEEQFIFLIKKYCQYCNVLEYRSLLWDLAIIAALEISQNEFPDIDLLANKCVANWDEYKDFSKGCMLERRVSIAFVLIRESEIPEDKLPLFCNAIKKYMDYYEDQLQWVNLLHNMLYHFKAKR